MKALCSILCIGVLLPAITNATEDNINNDAKQKIKIGISTGILKSFPSHNQTGVHLVEIEGDVYFGEVNIEYLFSKFRLACILGYYPDMLYGTLGPECVEEHLKVWEAKITIGYRVFSYQNLGLILYAGPILAWGEYWACLIPCKIETNTFCSPRVSGGLTGIEISKKFYKHLSMCLKISGKYYDLKDRDNRMFKIKGISFGGGLCTIF